MILLAIALAMGASGCGGGGGDAGGPPSVPNPEVAGFWTGTIGPNNRTLNTLTFADGEFWGFYSFPNNPNTLAGLLQARGHVAGRTITSNSTNEYNLEGNATLVIVGSLTATMVPQTSMSGAYSGSALNGTYSAAFDLGPSLPALAGTYTGTGLLNTPREAITMTITAGGAVTGSGSSGCAFSGTAAPHPSGKNAYSFSLTFGGAPCTGGTAATAGSGYFDVANKRLFVGTMAGARTPVIFQGTKP
jgi:hypothetical protein